MRNREVLTCALLIVAFSAAPAAMVLSEEQRINPVEREQTAPAAIKQKLEAIRADYRKKGIRSQVSYTWAFDQPFSVLLGDIDDKRITPAFRVEVQRQAMQLIKLDDVLRRVASANDSKLRRSLSDVALQLGCNAAKGSFSWHAVDKVTPVKRQICNNCWSYAAVGAYEASYLIRNEKTVTASEQYINDCAFADTGQDAGNCSGGQAIYALEYMKRKGNVDASTVPDTGQNSSCTNPPTPYQAVAWGFVDPNLEFATREQIKEALCTYGPLTTRMRIVSNAIKGHFGDQVYNEYVNSDSDGEGHAVLIVGWDDSKGAWQIKNSWGTDWGVGGFGWIGYGSNRIGRHTAWIRAASSSYNFSPIRELMSTQRALISQR